MSKSEAQRRAEKAYAERNVQIKINLPLEEAEVLDAARSNMPRPMSRPEYVRRQIRYALGLLPDGRADEFEPEE